MSPNINKGKWSNEIKQMRNVLITLSQVYTDPASVQGGTPLFIIQNAEEKLNAVNAIFQKQQKHSFYDKNSFYLEKLLIDITTKINDIKTNFFLAEKIATKIIKKHENRVEQIGNFYKTKNITALFGNNNFFEKSTISEYITWRKIKAKLEFFREFDNINLNCFNALSLLLIDNDEEFANHVENGSLAIAGEIGRLAIQRLHEIRSLSSSSKQAKNTAKNIIDAYVHFNSAENLFFYNALELKNEIIKLALHTLLHPDKKIAWLGTARTVDAMIQEQPGEATYFNPSQHGYSWELNRAWLQAAVELGYQFNLVEQHFPDVEIAILSQDPSNFLVQLSREVRVAGINNTSQYNGGDSPTATPQEILALMSMGCVGQKNQDGTLCFTPCPLQEEPVPLRNKERCSGLKRHHSSPNLFKIPPPPPLNNWIDHFQSPAFSSEKINIFTSGN